MSFLKALKSRLESPLEALDYALQFYNPDVRVSYSHKERISIIASIAPQKASAVADLGSSWGPLGQMFAKGGAYICCLDNWARVYRELAIPLAKYMGVLDKMAFIVGECHKLPFAEASFDLIICGEIIEHMKDARKFVAECSRILKPGGTILFSTPNARNPLRSLSFTFDFYSDKRHGHIHEFNPAEMQYLLESFSLEVREIVFFNFDLPPS